jgi:ADP-ribose pyrophosphatase YjhB (NUDIX family)
MSKKIITSYGLVLFTIHKNNVYYVTAKRRNSIPYLQVMCGRARDAAELEKYIRLLPTEERKMLLKHDCETLYRDLYPTDTRRYLQTLGRYRTQFQDMITKHKDILDQAAGCDFVQWEFPKGRRKQYETAVQCAAREFTEETGLTDFDIIIHNPITSQYVGYDGHYYKSIFFLAYTNKKCAIKYKYNPNLISKRYVSDEMIDARWMTLRQCEQFMDFKNRKVANVAFRMIMHNGGVVAQRPAPPQPPLMRRACARQSTLRVAGELAAARHRSPTPPTLRVL